MTAESGVLVGLMIVLMTALTVSGLVWAAVQDEKARAQTPDR